MKMLSSAPALAAILVLATALASAAARADDALANGGFESGDLGGWYAGTGWGAVGSFPSATALAHGGMPYLPLAGSYSALIVAMSGAPVPPASCAIDLWNINCPQPLPFSASGQPAPSHLNYQGVDITFAFYRGSFIGQDVAVQAGDTLSWHWQTFGEAGFDPGSVDRARFYATDGQQETWIDSAAALQSFQFPSAGVWSVYFGVYQGQDPYGYSAVLLDSVSVTSVPEPATRALGLLALPLALLLRARRRRHPG